MNMAGADIVRRPLLSDPNGAIYREAHPAEYAAFYLLC